MRISDWSSDVCSSDLHSRQREGHLLDGVHGLRRRRHRHLREPGERQAVRLSLEGTACRYLAHHFGAEEGRDSVVDSLNRESTTNHSGREMTAVTNIFQDKLEDKDEEIGRATG